MTTKSRITRIIIILLLLLAAPGVQAQAPQVASIPLSLNLSEINDLWFTSLDTLKNGDVEKALLDMEDLNLKKLGFGLANLSAYSQVLVREARNFQERGASAQAKNLLDMAQKLSPDLPDVYFALAGWRFKENMSDAYGVAKDLWKGYFLQLSEPSTLISYANKALILLLLAGILTSATFILLSFVYYRRAIFYQLKEKVPVKLPLFIAQIFGWIPIAVVTLGLGIAWGLLLLALLLIWHLDLSSKWILQVILLFGASLAIILIVLGISYTTFDGDYFQALSELKRGEFSSHSISVLQQQLQDNPEDVYAIFALGFIAQQNGRLDEAIEAYSMLPRQFADWPQAQNNLGNVYQQYYRQGEDPSWYQKSEDAYDDAIRQKPKMFEAHYNYAQLLLLENKSEDAGDEIKKARDINYERYTTYSQYVKDNIIVVDAPFSVTALIKRLFYQDFFGKGKVLAEAIWAGWSRFPNPWFFSIASGVLLVMSFAFGVQKKAQKSGVQYCQMCGDPYTVKKRKKKKDQKQESDTFCTQCTYIFKKKTVVKPEKRAAKIKQIQLRQKVRGLLVKVLSVCLPGSGQVYFGYPLKGTLIALLFYLGAAYYLMWAILRISLETPGTSGGISWGTLIFFGLLLGGSYLFNLYDVSRLSPKNQ
ncbi:MAG: tetratricopeptide repeat protein [bacterium]|nr:tetratricopeptide repeat protein [bacterium]